MIRRLFPQPITSVAVLALWLLLNGVSAAQAVLGVALALALPLLLPKPLLAPPHVRAPLAALRLVGVVLYDIVKANIEVALLILGPEARIRPGFVWVPLDLAAPQAISLFAGIITMTPGTLSCDITDDRRWLLVHCFHLDDAQAAVAEMKQRYEAPLKKIFR